MSEQIRAIAIDPGRTTGYSPAIIIPKQHMFFRPQQHMDDVDVFWNRLEAWKPRYIIIEDFEYRNRSRAGLVLFSVELIGVARLYAAKAEHQCAVQIQKASQGKSYYTNKVLQSLDLYKRGVPHALDSVRHLLQWITFGAGYQFNSTNAKINEFAHWVDEWPSS